jgi:hypothetical protein
MAAKDFVTKYRAKQSTYRENILKEPAGFGPNRISTVSHGNMLVNGEITGSNFISKIAFNYAKQKVLDKEINKSLTIDEYRLFNNMLSSMPMCFNLFSDLRQLLIDDSKEASRIVKELFFEIPWIDEVRFIDIEFIPTPIENYTNDRSAFDAMIIVKDVEGKKGLISIETKYTDILGDNVSSNSDKKDELSKRIFSKRLTEQLKNEGYKQIHRNFLLTYSYATNNHFKHFVNVIISPKEDVLSLNQISELRNEMIKNKDSLIKISLEDIVNRGINSKNEYFSNLMKEFENRYFID